ncbi:hypothetical protein DW914_11570 [Roseburia inulinivorans]|uniref:Uncharacterized protein n=1 Tax=Roseburia inulinivorans TaxID=360807 RepID=A0A3R6ACL2_9FIRM|nr:hypothetical protein DW914_11570 [Roseburia inulinivorans]
MRIGTAKFFTLLLLLYHTSVKRQGLSQISQFYTMTFYRQGDSMSVRSEYIRPAFQYHRACTKRGIFFLSGDICNAGAAYF